MKKLFVLFTVLIAVVAIIPLAAQSKSLDSMGLNGATGIYVVPTARVGFPDTQFGFNVGYHTNFFEPAESHLSQIPGLRKFTFVIDFFLADAFDSGVRSFGTGAVFGMSF